MKFPFHKEAHNGCGSFSVSSFWDVIEASMERTQNVRKLIPYRNTTKHKASRCRLTQHWAGPGKAMYGHLTCLMNLVWHKSEKKRDKKAAVMRRRLCSHEKADLCATLFSGMEWVVEVFHTSMLAPGHRIRFIASQIIIVQGFCNDDLRKVYF